jgi:hypothetical protein
VHAWMNVATWEPLSAVPSIQMLAAGGGLLFVAGLLIGLRRKTRVSLQRSPLADELMAYLGRIADAVERQADRPSPQQIVEMIERRIAEQQRRAETTPSATAGSGAAPKSRAVPFSMFGREYAEKS